MGEEVALLDGATTHPLRMAAESERGQLIPVQVELAHSTTTLFRKENCNLASNLATRRGSRSEKLACLSTCRTAD